MPRFLSSVAILAVSLFHVGCDTKSSTATRTAPARMVVPENQYSAIAEREIVRRKARIDAADQAALRAAQRDASGDTAGAIEEYSRALDTLPATR